RIFPSSLRHRSHDAPPGLQSHSRQTRADRIVRTVPLRRARRVIRSRGTRADALTRTGASNRARCHLDSNRGPRGDFERMTARALQICEETASNRELIEVRDLMRWLVHGSFVFLGYRRYLVSGDAAAARFVLDPGTELGVMRELDESRFRSSVLLDELSAARRKLFFEGPP